MRTYARTLLSGFALTLALGCGASKPPEAPLASGDAAKGAPNASGVASVLPELDANADATITADLAGIRANPMFSGLIADEADKKVARILEKLDRIDVRANAPDGREPEIVAVMWGKLPKDPREETSLEKKFDAPRPLASGVTEYVAQDSEMPAHIFAANDGVWVVSTGGATERVRNHYLGTSSMPAAPSSKDLLRIRANGAVLARAPAALSVLGSIDNVDISLGSGASTLKAVVSFTEPDAAKNAASQLRMMTGLLSMALLAKKDCKALDKISVDVSNSARDVTVEVKGIPEAVAAWDGKTCSGSGSKRRGPERRAPHQ